MGNDSICEITNGDHVLKYNTRVFSHLKENVKQLESESFECYTLKETSDIAFSHPKGSITHPGGRTCGKWQESPGTLFYFPMPAHPHPHLRFLGTLASLVQLYQAGLLNLLCITQSEFCKLSCALWQRFLDKEAWSKWSFCGISCLLNFPAYFDSSYPPLLSSSKPFGSSLPDWLLTQPALTYGAKLNIAQSLVTEWHVDSLLTPSSLFAKPLHQTLEVN